MISYSSSSFLNKFQKVQGNYENLIKLFEAPAIISEDEGYEAFEVNFLLYSREPEMPEQNKRGSCFELLKRLVVKNSNNSSTPLNKDTLVTILSRNPKLLKDMKQHQQQQGEEFENSNSFNPNERELIMAVDRSFYRIPTFDFAMVRQDQNIYICTALEMGNLRSERIFLKLVNFPEVLEGVLRNFMRKPVKMSLPTNSLPILPSIDTNSLVIQSSTIFENFIDDSSEESENDGEDNDEKENDGIIYYNHEKKKTIPTSTKMPPKKPKKSTYPNLENRLCLSCFCNSTPMWRRGPDGLASLCNACGVKFKAGRIVMSSELVEANKLKIQKLQNKKLLEQDIDQASGDQEPQKLQDYKETVVNEETVYLQDQVLTFHQY